MLQRVLRTARGHRHADVARDQREHVRGALHELLHVGDAGERVGDHGLFLRRQAGGAGDLLDVIAVGLGGGHAAGGGVRLLEESGIGEVGHHVADGRGAQAFAV